ncbi:MAG: M28 family peptidase [Desulfomicrobium escambiense]|nr:M28 family peptidase [Desulfomicrobium escambiense]
MLGSAPLDEDRQGQARGHDRPRHGRPPARRPAPGAGQHGTAKEWAEVIGAARADQLQLGGAGRATAPATHTPFFADGVPALFLFTGMHADYHRPTDTVDKLSFPGIEKVARFAFRLARAVAGRPASPHLRARHAPGGQVVARPRGQSRGNPAGSARRVPSREAWEPPAGFPYQRKVTSRR